jgi:hypothetical protein
MFIFDFLSERSSGAWRAGKKQMQNAQPCKDLYHESEYNSTKLFCRKAWSRLSPVVAAVKIER